MSSQIKKVPIISPMNLFTPDCFHILAYDSFGQV